MKKTVLIFLILLALVACGFSFASDESKVELKKTPVILSDDKEKEVAVTETKKDPSAIYEEALDNIASGNTVEGIQMLATIPSYQDAELYLYGYSFLEYYIGEWEADLKSDFDKGITVFPCEMTFIVSDTNIWLDNEVNGFQRLRFPVSVEYTMWKDSKTETGEEDYQAYLLFKSEDGKVSSDDCILFGLETGGVWYNLYSDTPDRSKCTFSVSDSSGEIDTKANNIFYCDRVSEQQNSGITWNKTSDSATNSQDHNSSDSNNTQKTSTANASSGEKNAFARAMQYLDYTAFSYAGLIEQLEYEGFSHSEACYAADNCGVNWNEQAAIKALLYLDYSAFSYDGLIEQLEYEGFTPSEAQYGADNCGVDWNVQAAKKAEQYLEYSSFSKSELIEQLVFEGFTQSQAEYGVNKAY